MEYNAMLYIPDTLYKKFLVFPLCCMQVLGGGHDDDDECLNISSNISL